MVFVTYAVLLGAIVAGQGITAPIRIGRANVDRSDRSPKISALQAASKDGYDGQFVYYIALDPLRARYYLDRPSYRYGRILYPALAWLAAFGQPGALPYTMLGINLLAVVATVFLLAGFLRRRSVSAWWAAVYGFFPGMLTCVTSDLTEPLAYLLAALGVILYLRFPERARWCIPCLALAALGRETTLVFAGVVAVTAFARGRSGLRFEWPAIGRGLLILAGSCLPLIMWRYALDRWLGSGLSEGSLEFLPFGGLLPWPLDFIHRLIVLAVVVPGLAWLAFSAFAVARGRFSLAVALVIANALCFVVFLPPLPDTAYSSAGRSAIGLVLAAVLAFPHVRDLPRRNISIPRIGLILLTPAWFGVAAAIAALT